jgi:hypothetical protein
MVSYLSVVDLLLNGATGDQPEDGHRSALPNPPGPFPGLAVSGGVPVRVVDHHPIGTSQVDPKPTNLGG